MYRRALPFPESIKLQIACLKLLSVLTQVAREPPEACMFSLFSFSLSYEVHISSMLGVRWRAGNPTVSDLVFLSPLR